MVDSGCWVRESCVSARAGAGGDDIDASGAAMMAMMAMVIMMAMMAMMATAHHSCRQVWSFLRDVSENFMREPFIDRVWRYTLEHDRFLLILLPLAVLPVRPGRRLVARVSGGWLLRFPAFPLHFPQPPLVIELPLERQLRDPP